MMFGALWALFLPDIGGMIGGQKKRIRKEGSGPMMCGRWTMVALATLRRFNLAFLVRSIKLVPNQTIVWSHTEMVLSERVG